MLQQLTAELEDARTYELDVNTKLREQVEELAALATNNMGESNGDGGGNVSGGDNTGDGDGDGVGGGGGGGGGGKGAKIESVLAHIRLQLDDNAAWQGRVHRLGTEISRLQDDIASLRMAEADLVFSNHALKSELCGRIQQLQLMSKGMHEASDAVYGRILCEMEQNSMKAYAHHARKTAQASASSTVPAMRPATQEGDPNGSRGQEEQQQGQKRYRRNVSVRRGPSGFGVVIAGGDMVNGSRTPTIVHSVKESGPAALTGAIFERDVVLSVNGREMETFASHTELVESIRGSDDLTFELVSAVATNYDGPKPAVAPATPASASASASASVSASTTASTASSAPASPAAPQPASPSSLNRSTGSANGMSSPTSASAAIELLQLPYFKIGSRVTVHGYVAEYHRWGSGGVWGWGCRCIAEVRHVEIVAGRTLNSFLTRAPSPSVLFSSFLALLLMAPCTV